MSQDYSLRYKDYYNITVNKLSEKFCNKKRNH
jgi:hypothetical protein